MPTAIALAIAVLAMLSALAIMTQINGPGMTDGNGPTWENLDMKEGPSDDSNGNQAIDWDHWQSVNPDIVGWISIAGTSIDYPLVQAQSEEPDYYLNHDVYRQWSPWGCPYIDAGCIEGLDSDNVVVYGHNISTDESMFHDLSLFHDESFARGHSSIQISTPTHETALSVSGVMTIDGSTTAKQTHFDGAWDFKHYLTTLQGMLDISIAPLDEGKRLFTLCTCSYFENPGNERTIVLAQTCSAETEDR